MTNLNRRAFLKNTISKATLASAVTLGTNLSLSNAVLAQTSSRFDDYKALVCVFLYGGADSYNLLVPTNTSEYRIYESVRQNLAYAQDTLLPLNVLSGSPYPLGMPESAEALQQLFNQQKMSIVSNVGPLPSPLTKPMILQDDSLLPPQLFSHNDQQSLWQSATQNTSSTNGWAGRMADLISDTDDSLSMNLSLFGSNLYQSGTRVQPFSLDSSGPEAFAALDPSQSWNADRIDLFDRMIQDSSHILHRAYASKLVSAATNNERLLQAISTSSETNINYPNGNELSSQLRMVARLIGGNQFLNQPRQIFFVGLGGWDTHDAQNTLHPGLIQNLGEALSAFQSDLEERGLSNQVTTFTMSEFGRTLTSNGDGTDHGWGGHQLVMGGAVNGGNIFGTLPALELNSEDDLGDGRMIPSLSIDQFAEPLTRWFGMSNSEINAVFPNLQRFDSDVLNLFSSNA